MTREEEIINAANELCNSFRCGKTYKLGFAIGVKWADKHPKLPWISVKDDLPCNHEELIVDTPLYKRTKPVVCNKPCGIRVDQMVCDMSLNGWYWTGETPIHWFPAPELPKE